MTIDEQCDEYLDCLVSIELAAAISRKYGQPVNRTIKACCSALLGRIRDRRNYLIFEGIKKQPFPDGAVKMLRRRLDECLGDEKHE